MLFRLERNPECTRSRYITGLIDDDTPPDWIEVLAIQPDKLVAYEEPHLKHVQRIDCIYLCMSHQGFSTTDSRAIMDMIGDNEYRVVTTPAKTPKRPPAKRARKSPRR